MEAASPPAAFTGADTPPPSHLRIGSLNVHGFKDAKGRNRTLGTVARLLDANRLDIIALQEARWHDVVELARELGNMFWVTSRSTALLSRFPLRTTDEYGCGVGNKNFTAPHFHVSKIKRSGCEARHARANAMLPPELGGGALELVSIHLDHVAEPRRLAQLQQLMWHVTTTEAATADSAVAPGPRAKSASSDGGRCRRTAKPPADSTGSLSDAVWMGDFNALARADYDEAEWQEVAAVRARGNWEAPVSEVTGAITGETSRGGLGFVDARVAAADAPGPRSTCRYDTRIDYIFLGQGVARRWRVAACEHVVAIPAVTDHNLVVATLERA